jgi:hypothetical protein
MWRCGHVVIHARQGSNGFGAFFTATLWHHHGFIDAEHGERMGERIKLAREVVEFGEGHR